MNTKLVAIAFCSVLAVTAALPAVQAAHFTWYNNGTIANNLHGQESFATFEGNSKGAPNYGQPGSVSPSDGMPVYFQGLADRLVAPLTLTKSADVTKYGSCTLNDPKNFCQAELDLDVNNVVGAHHREKGNPIFDVHLYGNPMQSGHLLPLNYYVDEAGLGSHYLPTATFLALSGYFYDVNSVSGATSGTRADGSTWNDGDGVINERSNSGEAAYPYCDADQLDDDGDYIGCSYRANKPATYVDEFIWRGANSGELGLSPVTWLFPTDHYSSWGQRLEPVAFAGSCHQFSDLDNNPSTDDNPDCMTPTPDFDYSDESDEGNNYDNQRMAAGSGGGDYWPEEFLVIDVHAISTLGASQIPGHFAIYDAACAELLEATATVANRDCLRDYDYYQALAGPLAPLLVSLAQDDLAGEDVDPDDDVRVSLRDEYTASRPIADDTTADPNDKLFDSSIDAIVFETNFGNPVPDVNPVAAYDRDYRHLDAAQGCRTTVSGPVCDSTYTAYAAIAFSNPVPAFTNAEPAVAYAYCHFYTEDVEGVCTAASDEVGSGAQGFYGDYATVGNVHGSRMSTARQGGIIRAAGEAWLWKDDNGDGYIGVPFGFERTAFEKGVDDSANGPCQPGQGPGGAFCENIGKADLLAPMVVKMTYGAAFWPPGTVLLKRYEQPMGQQPIHPYGEEPWLVTVAGNTAYLRFEKAYCTSSDVGCRTKDALFIPSGTLQHGIAAELGTLSGSTFTGGITIAWSEGSNDYTKSFTPTDFAENLETSAAKAECRAMAGSTWADDINDPDAVDAAAASC